MKIPSSRVVESLRQLVRLQSETYSVERPGATDHEKGRFGESTPTTSTVQVDCVLTTANSAAIETEFGDRLSGSLRGIALPTETVTVNDQFQYNGQSYEVTEVVTLPRQADESESGVVQLFGLVERVNDR